jgi:hypothetical protein
MKIIAKNVIAAEMFCEINDPNEAIEFLRAME